MVSTLEMVPMVPPEPPYRNPRDLCLAYEGTPQVIPALLLCASILGSLSYANGGRQQLKLALMGELQMLKSPVLHSHYMNLVVHGVQYLCTKDEIEYNRVEKFRYSMHGLHLALWRMESFLLQTADEDFFAFMWLMDGDFVTTMTKLKAAFEPEAKDQALPIYTVRSRMAGTEYMTDAYGWLEAALTAYKEFFEGG